MRGSVDKADRSCAQVKFPALLLIPLPYRGPRAGEVLIASYARHERAHSKRDPENPI